MPDAPVLAGLAPLDPSLASRLAGSATVAFAAVLDRPLTLLGLSRGANEVLAFAVRRLSGDRLDPWERRQNYASFVDADGGVDVLEVRVTVSPPPGIVRGVEAESQAWIARVRENGLVRLGVPLREIGGGRERHRIAVRIDSARVDLVVDGVIVDSDWPCGRWSAEGATLVVDPSVQVLAAAPRALGDAEADWRPREHPPMAQHWCPTGHNVWAGDPMWCSTADRLHLYWLADRGSGDSKWGCGAHQFALHTTGDLVRWQPYGVVYPITEPHELSLGTGAIVEHEGTFHLFSRHCQERFGPEFGALHPGGMHHASGACDRFVKLGPCIVTGRGRTEHDLGHEPGVLRGDDGLWHAAAAGTRLTSSDLHCWTVADAEFLPPVGWPCTRTVPSNECTCWFRWGEWHYVLSGRTGFWRSRALAGPYWGDSPGVSPPAWDLYDGLMVPQATVFRGRGILAGWLARDEGFAGHLVFRELHQRADGNLELRRLPELEPPCGAPQSWSVEPAAGVVREDGRIVISADGAVRAARLIGRQGDLRLRARLSPSGCRRYGLRVLGDGREACELRLEPGRARAQWGTSRAGAPAADSERMPFDGHDFAILGVERLDRPVIIDVLVRRDHKSGTTIVDGEIDGRRTLVTRRREAGAAVSFWCDSGTLAVDELSVRAVAAIR